MAEDSSTFQLMDSKKWRLRTHTVDSSHKEVSIEESSDHAQGSPDGVREEWPFPKHESSATESPKRDHSSRVPKLDLSGVGNKEAEAKSYPNYTVFYAEDTGVQLSPSTTSRKHNSFRTPRFFSKPTPPPTTKSLQPRAPPGFSPRRFRHGFRPLKSPRTYSAVNPGLNFRALVINVSTFEMDELVGSLSDSPRSPRMTHGRNDVRHDFLQDGRIVSATLARTPSNLIANSGAGYGPEAVTVIDNPMKHELVLALERLAAPRSGSTPVTVVYFSSNFGIWKLRSNPVLASHINSLETLFLPLPGAKARTSYGDASDLDLSAALSAAELRARLRAIPGHVLLVLNVLGRGEMCIELGEALTAEGLSTNFDESQSQEDSDRDDILNNDIADAEYDDGGMAGQQAAVTGAVQPNEVTVLSCKSAGEPTLLMPTMSLFTRYFVNGFSGDAVDRGQPTLTLQAMIAYLKRKVTGHSVVRATPQHPQLFPPDRDFPIGYTEFALLPNSNNASRLRSAAPRTPFVRAPLTTLSHFGGTHTQLFGATTTTEMSAESERVGRTKFLRDVLERVRNALAQTDATGREILKVHDSMVKRSTAAALQLPEGSLLRGRSAWKDYNWDSPSCVFHPSNTVPLSALPSTRRKASISDEVPMSEDVDGVVAEAMRWATGFDLKNLAALRKQETKIGGKAFSAVAQTADGKLVTGEFGLLKLWNPAHISAPRLSPSTGSPKQLSGSVLSPVKERLTTRNWEPEVAFKAHETYIFSITEIPGLGHIATGSFGVIHVWDPSRTPAGGPSVMFPSVQPSPPSSSTTKRSGFSPFTLKSPIARSPPRSAGHPLRSKSSLPWHCDRKLVAHNGWVTNLAVCAGHLVSGGRDGVIKIWNPMRDYGLVRTLSLETSYVDAIVPLPKGFMSLSGDKQLKVWDKTKDWDCVRAAYVPPSVSRTTGLPHCSGLNFAGGTKRALEAFLAIVFPELKYHGRTSPRRFSPRKHKLRSSEAPGDDTAEDLLNSVFMTSIEEVFTDRK